MAEHYIHTPATAAAVARIGRITAVLDTGADDLNEPLDPGDGARLSTTPD